MTERPKEKVPALLGSLRLVLRRGSVLLVERGVADFQASHRGDSHQKDQDEGDADQQAGEEPCADIMLASVIAASYEDE